MQVQHTINGKEGKFYIKDGAAEIGEMLYNLEGNTMTIHHTEVDPAYKGQNLGAQLVEAGISEAREKGYKIVPICPFAYALMKRRSDLQDVLK